MTGKKKTFLSPAQLLEALKEVAIIAKSEHVRIALLGGYALQQYGSDRLTGDIDVVSEKLLEGLPSGKTLSFGGEQTEAPNGVPVDLVIRDDDFKDLYTDALAKAQRVSGMPIPVVRPEHLVAMKMVAGRARDTTDLEFLIASGEADRAKSRAVVKAFLGNYAAKEFDRHFEEVLWKKSKGLI